MIINSFALGFSVDESKTGNFRLFCVVYVSIAAYINEATEEKKSQSKTESCEVHIVKGEKQIVKCSAS
jgi:hypothetical protein